VAKVDELMGLCDELEAQQQERELRKSVLVRSSLSRFAESPTRENLGYLFHNSYDIPPSDLRKSILTLAVQGKLVPQDPEDEPAEVDHEAVVRTRANSTLKLTKIDSEATAVDPVMPDTWMSVCLGDLVSIRTGFAFKSGDYTEHGTFILRVTNINSDGSFDTSNSVYLPDEKLDHKMRGYLLEEHELLVVMVGGSLGKIGLVTAAILPALLNQNMWRLKPYSDRLDFRFLKLVLYDLNENRLQITKSTHGHLAMGTYAAAKVPFPPLAEQHRIVAKVDQLMALVDELERQQAASREKASNLLDAIVHEMTGVG
jgi:type I restriction enzyme S subunit